MNHNESIFFSGVDVTSVTGVARIWIYTIRYMIARRGLPQKKFLKISLICRPAHSWSPFFIVF